MLFWLAGCSFTTFDSVECEDASVCRDAFGLLSTCGEAGFCQAGEVHVRCTSTEPEDLFIRPELYGDHILLGSMFDHSADIAEIQSVRLPFMQVNEEGGLQDTEYGLIECTYEEEPALDALDYPSSARAVSQWLVDVAGVSGIIGPATSSQTQEVYNATADAGVLIISPSATSPALQTIDGLTKSDEDPGTLWRTAPPDSLQGVAVAADMRARRLKDVAVMYQSGPYGEGLAEVFLASFTEGPENAVGVEFSTSGEMSDGLATLVNQELPPEEVFFISSELTDIVAFLDGAASLTDSPFVTGEVTIFLADGAADEQIFEGPPDEVFSYVRGTRPSVPSGLVYDAFSIAYAAAYPGDSADDSVYTAYSYDASWLAIYGTAWSHYDEGEIYGVGMARGLRNISSGTETEIRPTRWNEVKASFEAGSSIDVLGASGNLDYDPDTEETTAPIEVFRPNDARDGFDHCTTYCWEEGVPTECALGTEVPCEAAEQ
ncbi:MAG: ABC transporter substrate-binding protein [Proteobacteria bacterium]|nr:ABC transporter substrate-binding protein [Pseudomonadota bacterium]MCP4918612.1 ABC transporter substrate-binding protein [Pseudomonadota bacterium]